MEEITWPWFEYLDGGDVEVELMLEAETDDGISMASSVRGLLGGAWLLDVMFRDVLRWAEWFMLRSCRCRMHGLLNGFSDACALLGDVVACLLAPISYLSHSMIELIDLYSTDNVTLFPITLYQHIGSENGAVQVRKTYSPCTSN